ncbi:MAG: family 16 glycosylhydrolase [Flavobacteriales bacterium]
MKKTLAIILSAFTFTSSGQVMWEIKNNEVVKWKYHSGDEFNGSTLNESYWHTGPPYGRANMVLNSYHAAENVKVIDGHLSVFVDSNQQMKPIEPWLIDSAYLKKNNIKAINGQYKFKYTVGMAWSKPFYKYGYFETRFKADKGQGLWPAFWLYGQNQNDEIDFFELKGEKLNKIHVDVHCKTGCDNGYKTWFRKVNWGGWVDVKEYLSDGYNTISGIWEPGFVTWYLNGYMIGKFKGDFETRMSLILNTALTKDGYAFSPGADAQTPFPAGMAVDYVRVFGKSDTSKITNAPTFGYIKDTTNIIIPKKIKAKKFIFKRKRDDDVTGFISYYKLDHNTLLFELKGKISKPILELTDDTGKKVVSKVLDSSFNQVDITGFKHGKYKLTIVQVDKKLVEDEISLLH